VSSDIKKIKKDSRVKKFLYNPFFILIVSLIVGSLITLLIQHITEKNRELAYAVNPIRTQIVTADNTSSLSVLYNGENLGSVNITAAQIAIWNSGDLNIEKEDILKEIIIYTEPSVNILEVKIVKNMKEYEITKLIIDDSYQNLQNGRIPVSWKILEKNDGVSIQIIYQGSTDVKINVAGYIKDAGYVKRLEPKQESDWLRYLYGGGVLFCMVLFYFFRNYDKIFWIVGIIFSIVLIIYISVSVTDCINIAAKAFSPPFGF
jgi:hypothetical protein